MQGEDAQINKAESVEYNSNSPCNKYSTFT